LGSLLFAVERALATFACGGSEGYRNFVKSQSGD
jgi:hypothetical protein